MKSIEGLGSRNERYASGLPEAREGRSGSGRPARFWSRRNTSPRFYLAFLFIAAAAVIAGCGGATAPCPTPTSELDQLRSRTEQLGQEVDQATSTERRAAAERDGAARRVAAARAALDSLNASAGGGR